MMKKLLVLMLVLGLASLANAGLTWTVDEYVAGDTATVTLSADFYVQSINIHEMVSAEAGTWAIASDAFLGSELGPTVFNTTLTAWSANLVAGDTLGITGDLVTFTLVVANGTTTPFDVTFPTGIPAFVFHSYVTDMSNVETELAGYAIPEPMTMALLGLGGLFLRRRK